MKCIVIGKQVSNYGKKISPCLSLWFCCGGDCTMLFLFLGLFFAFPAVTCSTSPFRYFFLFVFCLCVATFRSSYVFVKVLIIFFPSDVGFFRHVRSLHPLISKTLLYGFTTVLTFILLSCLKGVFL